MTCMKTAKMIIKIFTFIYNWAMNAKGGEDATKVGVYYIQEWE